MAKSGSIIDDFEGPGCWKVSNVEHAPRNVLPADAAGEMPLEPVGGLLVVQQQLPDRLELPLGALVALHVPGDMVRPQKTESTR